MEKIAVHELLQIILMSSAMQVILRVLLQSWDMLLSLWYYVIAGIVAGGLASAFIRKESLTKLFSVRIGALLPVAAVAGMASPLCTYSTVPFFTGLLRQGMPIGAVAAFLVASASINPQLLVLSRGTLGIQMVIGQVVSIFLMAVVIGKFASATHQKKIAEIDNDVDAKDVKCKLSVQRSAWQEFSRSTLGICEHISLYFLLGIIAANAVLIITGGKFFDAWLGPGHWYSVPLAGLCAVPLYACGGAMLPILKIGASNGMTQGAILAFLIAGPATRVTSLIGISTIFTRRVVVMYVVYVVIFSTLCGLAFDALMKLFT